MHPHFSLQGGSISMDIKIHTSATLGKQGPLTSIFGAPQDFSDSSVGKDSACNAGDISSIPGSGRSFWQRDKLPTPVFFGFPCGSAGEESACNVGDLGLIPELGRSHGVRKGYPLQYSGLENSIDCIVHGVTNSHTRLSNFHFQLFRPSNLLPSPNSKYFSKSYNRALKCDSVKW